MSPNSEGRSGPRQDDPAAPKVRLPAVLRPFVEQLRPHPSAYRQPSVGEVAERWGGFWTDWRALHDELRRCPWFARVGQPTERDHDPRILRVASWPEAVRWAKAEISWSCAYESANVLSGYLHEYHRDAYREWNNHVESFGPALDELMAGPVTAAMPGEYRTAEMIEWVQSHVRKAYLECVYSSLSPVRVASEQVAWYLAGYFPCGWAVPGGEERFDEEFPEQAITVLF